MGLIVYSFADFPSCVFLHGLEVRQGNGVYRQGLLERTTQYAVERIHHTNSGKQYLFCKITHLHRVYGDPAISKVK